MQENLYILRTSDGSNTLFNTLVGESYHSRHGALQESQHVFINNGLRFLHHLYPEKKIFSVLEIGFGTGLNFLLSKQYSEETSIQLHYHGVEAHPLEISLIEQTGYQALLNNTSHWEEFLKNYTLSFSEEIAVSASSQLKIFPQKVLEFTTEHSYDIIYFDAFAAIHQPEMWTEEVLKHVCSFLKDKGIFVTYSVTGHLKRMLHSLGFSIERPKGAAGKREMMRAIKHQAKHV